MPHVWALIWVVAQGCQMRDKQIMSTEKVACNNKEERDWNDLLIKEMDSSADI